MLTWFISSICAFWTAPGSLEAVTYEILKAASAYFARELDPRHPR